VFGRRRVFRELAEETRSHLEEKVEELVAGGMSPGDAEAAPRREFGNWGLVERDGRGVWRWGQMEDFFTDLRFGLRMFRKNPGFTAVALLTLALGIGASTIIFSIVHAVLLTPLPYRDSGRLVVIYDRETRATGLSKLMDLYEDFETYRDSGKSFEQMAGMTWVPGSATLTGFGLSKEVRQAQATVGFFSLLGMAPKLGRTFEPADMARGCTVVVAYSFWRDVLGENREIGRDSIDLDGQGCDVIGVMPERFAFFPAETQVWTLINSNSNHERDPLHSDLAIYARLKPGVSTAAALAEVRLLHSHANQRERHALDTEPLVLPLQGELTWLAGPNLRLSLIVLFGAVSALLLIGCGNVANLLIARSLAREREIAIRSALGSGVQRLLRQLLTEGLLLSLCAAGLGACLAAGVLHWFNAAQPVALPPGAVVRINAPVLLFAATVSVVASVVFGFVPAWKATKVDLVEALKANSQSTTSGTGKRTIGKVLIVAEVASSLVLLVGAALLIESAARFASIPLGFAPNRVVTAAISLPPKTYPADVDRVRIYERIFDQLEALPGTPKFALSSLIPFRAMNGFDALEVEGRQQATGQTIRHDSGRISISPQYFATLGIPLLEGRTFNADDQSQTEPVAIVNEALAKKYFDEDDPIGRHIRSVEAPAGRNPWRRIVGVVGSEKRGNPFQEMSWLDTPALFVPVSQEPPSRATLLIASKIDPIGFGTVIQQRVSAIDPSIPVSNFQTVEGLLLKEHLAFPRFRALVVGCFSGFALLLAVVGLYGVLSQLVTQRTHEIGLRMSLGAEAGTILMMVLKEGMVLVGLGVALGAAGASAVSRFLESLLYGVKSTDPVTVVAVSLLLVLAALVATLVPARKAMRVDPMVALRCE
jgi:predicted permease